jgi:hypothetical protein
LRDCGEGAGTDQRQDKCWDYRPHTPNENKMSDGHWERASLSLHPS